MADIRDIEVVVFDVLGTLVDEPGGLRAGISEAVPAADEAAVDALLTLWQRHIEDEQRRIVEGGRKYVNSEILDREAAQRVADSAASAERAGSADSAASAGSADPAVLARLATAGQRLAAWGDTVAGLERIARQLPVIALSNAGHTALLRLSAYAGLRWHQALSGETVQAYKPSPEIYRLAFDTAGCPPDRVLMVAAHSWDLRGAQTAGMRTAYVQRPIGDSPTAADAFDWRFDGLDGLAAALEARR